MRRAGFSAGPPRENAAYQPLKIFLGVGNPANSLNESFPS
jgi:hypothetical protein